MRWPFEETSDNNLFSLSLAASRSSSRAATEVSVKAGSKFASHSAQSQWRHLDFFFFSFSLSLFVINIKDSRLADTTFNLKEIMLFFSLYICVCVCVIKPGNVRGWSTGRQRSKEGGHECFCKAVRCVNLDFLQRAEIQDERGRGPAHLSVISLLCFLFLLWLGSGRVGPGFGFHLKGFNQRLITLCGFTITYFTSHFYKADRKNDVRLQLWDITSCTWNNAPVELYSTLLSIEHEAIRPWLLEICTWSSSGNVCHCLATAPWHQFDWLSDWQETSCQSLNQSNRCHQLTSLAEGRREDKSSSSPDHSMR